MPKDIELKHGKLILTDDVLATIAGVAATECYGVVGMASRKLKDGIAELLGRENLRRGIEVGFDGDQLIIDLYVVIGYGTRVSEVAHNISTNVRYAIEKMTGLTVVRVGIHVQGVRVGHN